MADMRTSNLENKRGLLFKAGSKVADLTNIFQPATSKPASRRTRHKAQVLLPGEDIFHNYKLPQTSPQESEPIRSGKKRYRWTPARTEGLRRLIIHSDVKFDDISIAMRDDTGEGPCESTCRDYWHEIFGYSPDLARLKSSEGRAQRHNDQVRAFAQFKEKQWDMQSSAEPPVHRVTYYDNVTFAACAAAKASTDTGVHNRTALDMPCNTETGSLGTYDSACHNPHHQPPGHIAPISDSLPHNVVPVKSTPAAIEEKEGLEPGFLAWLRRFSASSYASSKRSSATSAFNFKRVSTHISSGSSSARPADSPDAKVLVQYLEKCSAKNAIDLGRVQHLIALGADVNAKNERGETSLHFAVALGSIPVMALLLELNADSRARTFNGVSIWTFARINLSANTYGLAPKDRENMRCRVEFARATVKYNPCMVREDTQSRKRHRKRFSAESPRPSQRRQHMHYSHHVPQHNTHANVQAISPAAMSDRACLPQTQFELGHFALNTANEPALASVPAGLALYSNDATASSIWPQADLPGNAIRTSSSAPWPSAQDFQTQELTMPPDIEHFEPIGNMFIDTAQSTDNFFPDLIHFRQDPQYWI